MKLALAALMLTTAIAVFATQPLRSPQPMTVTVDSVSCREDLARVYCKIEGQPHTSNRIDLATLTVNGAELTATDIDGVDFKRYFQWEDEGVIPLEIDFPPIDTASGKLSLTTIRGVVSVNL